MSHGATHERQLLELLERIWQSYREAGPGQVDLALYENVEATAATLVAALPDSQGTEEGRRLIESVETGVKLARRCALQPEGLCFITGEAGLVPRKDLHEKFEEALATIRLAAEAGTD